ncbi:MAG TPA: 50S ribosomal protein L22 [Methanocorpusculum sp.]|nr:50S ribosomal protein L22 [Methanocorpusculum sp.]
MARTEYCNKLTGDNIARAKANELGCSPKHAVEIAHLIRNMMVDDAISYLEQVINLKKAVPFHRYARNVSHQRCLNGKTFGTSSGRYPVKAAAEYLRLIRSAQKNAEYMGLTPEKMVIIHAAANKGRCIKAIFPRAMGRATPKHRDTVNIEIILREGQ